MVGTSRGRVYDFSSITSGRAPCSSSSRSRWQVEDDDRRWEWRSHWRDGEVASIYDLINDVLFNDYYRTPSRHLDWREPSLNLLPPQPVMNVLCTHGRRRPLLTQPPPSRPASPREPRVGGAAFHLTARATR